MVKILFMKTDRRMMTKIPRPLLQNKDIGSGISPILYPEYYLENRIKNGCEFGIEKKGGTSVTVIIFSTN